MVIILVFKNLIIKSYIINKIEQATLTNSFTRECYLDNDLQVIEYVTDDIAVYEYYDEDDVKKDIIEVQNFNSKKIYSIDTTTNTITDTRDYEEDFTENVEYKETKFNQNKTLYEDIKSGSIKNFKFTNLEEANYIVFQVYHKDSAYEIFFLNLNTNFIDKVIMIGANKNSYTSIVRDYNIINEDNSSQIDLYLKMTEGL